MQDPQSIAKLIKSIRFPFLVEEYQIHEKIAEIFSQNHLDFVHEYKLGPYARIDFFVDGVGIEVKKGKQSYKSLLAQLKKYAAYPDICAIIVVVQSAVKLPAKIVNKPIFCIPLYQSWSVSL